MVAFLLSPSLKMLLTDLFSVAKLNNFIERIIKRLWPRKAVVDVEKGEGIAGNKAVHADIPAEGPRRVSFKLKYAIRTLFQLETCLIQSNNKLLLVDLVRTMIWC